MMTRWHEDDLAGRLIELSKKDHTVDQWEVLMLPAICEPETRHPNDPRDGNMALWPEKYNYTELMKYKATVGIYDWSAMYQQRLQPAGGTIFSAWVDEQDIQRTTGRGADNPGWTQLYKRFYT